MQQHLDGKYMLHILVILNVIEHNVEDNGCHVNNILLGTKNPIFKDCVTRQEKTMLFDFGVTVDPN